MTDSVREEQTKLAFLAAASKILASSLDYKTTLANVAKLAVPQIADWCSVTIKNGPALEQLAVAHKDPKKVKWAKELSKKNPPDPNAETGVPRVIRTGKSELYPVITDKMLVAAAKNKEQLVLLRKLKISSAMIVPFLLKGKAIGAITFVAAESGKHYTKTDLAIAQEVASRMALAIENARLFAQAQTANEMLKKLAAIVESSNDAIIGKSIDGIITSWNHGAQRLYGYKAEEIVGKHVSILMPFGKKDEFAKIMDRLKKGKRIERYETKRQTKDGRILDVSITVSPIRNAEGKIIGASKIARDITFQKKVEERQKFLEKASYILGASIDYEMTLKNLAKIIVPYLADYCRIVVVDDRKQIKEITVNHTDRKKIPLVKELYEAYKNGTNNTAGVGKLLATGISEQISKIEPEVYKSASPKVVKLVKQLKLQSYMGVPMKIGNRIVGALTFSSTSVHRLYTKEDLAVAEELARRAALAIENARLFAQSQKAVAIRDEFISVASHELKTPVTSLKMYAQVLQQQFAKRGGDPLLKYFAKIDDQVDKLNLLISDLLNVSKLQHGKLEFTFEKLDLNDLLKNSIEEIKTTVRKHKLVLQGKIERKVFGDRYRLDQVVTNLLTNAVKYSPKADKVVVRLTSKKDMAVVTVQDFGIGIDKEHTKRIFDRFYRVTSSDEKTYPGLGMGLFIASEIVRRHGGQMSVVSQKGKGSSFSFTLPYAK